MIKWEYEVRFNKDHTGHYDLYQRFTDLQAAKQAITDIHEGLHPYLMAIQIEVRETGVEVNLTPEEKPRAHSSPPSLDQGPVPSRPQTEKGLPDAF